MNILICEFISDSGSTHAQDRRYRVPIQNTSQQDPFDAGVDVSSRIPEVAKISLGFDLLSGHAGEEGLPM